MFISRIIVLALLLISGNAFSQVDERFGFVTPYEPANSLGMVWYYNYTFNPPPRGMKRLYPVGYLYRYKEEADRIGIKNDHGSYQVYIDSTGIYLPMDDKAGLADLDHIFIFKAPFIAALISGPDSSSKSSSWFIGNELNGFLILIPTIMPNIRFSKQVERK